MVNVHFSLKLGFSAIHHLVSADDSILDDIDERLHTLVASLKATINETSMAHSVEPRDKLWTLALSEKTHMIEERLGSLESTKSCNVIRNVCKSAIELL